LIFSAIWDAANRHGRLLEPLESEHRPDSLLYPAMICSTTLFKYLQDRTPVLCGL
jgi:hypothetical protein